MRKMMHVISTSPKLHTLHEEKTILNMRIV